MANGTRVKIITGVVILLAAAFVLLAFYMIPAFIICLPR